MKILLAALMLLLAQTPAQTGNVAGRVFKPDNSPASGMSVELLRLDFNNEGVREWHPVEGEATTDAQGSYRISGVRPGQYYLRAIKRPPVGAGGIVTASSVDWIPTTYFPGTLNAALASSFTAAAGQSVTMDLAIPQTNPYSVSGRIVNSLPDTGGRPIQLVLLRRDFGAPVETQSALSLETLRLPAGGDGKFEIRGVPSGSYELFGGSDQNWIARATFEVADQDVDGVSATIRAGVDVKGKLTVLGDSTGFQLFQSGSSTAGAVAGTQVAIQLKPNDGSPLRSLRPPKIDALTFSFENVPPGTYSMQVSITGERRTAYVADIRSGGRSIFGESVVISDSSPDPIEIVVNINGASVPVAVAGTSASSATVVLIPAPPYRRNPHRYNRSVMDNSAGTVTLHHVAPGDYTAHAWEYPTTFAWPFMDPAFIAKHGARGVQIKVGEGPVSTVAVPLVRVD